ncbi:protein GOLM2 isoform X2 [Bufo gargarizans]|uniref:protein GOLM2 isoform X2 n=1 Tax=Bufo gargarizans TaxID=30331 RepID=UPI001CF1477A|nr:protein GOLM2 isoform X2 [Bufo gargarizans]
MVGFGAPRRTGRLPPFVLVALLVVIALLAFNYWSVSARQAALQGDLAALQEQVQRTEVARSRLEKRHSELMVQSEGNRRQLEQRLGEFQNIGDRLQARDLEAQRCEADREKLLGNVSLQMVDITHLKEQLHELHQEFLRQENQLLEYKKNNTLLQKALKEESVQCAKQLADQKREHEESIKRLQQTDKDKEEVEKSPNNVAAGEPGSDNKMDTITAIAREERMEEPSSNRLHFERDAAKAGGDAGMPEIEDSEPAKPDTVPTVKKKVDIGALTNEIGESEKQPSLQPDSIANAQAKYLPPGAKKDSASPIEDNALHFGQVPQKQIPKDTKSMVFPNIKQSRFFDENESPVDAQHGSKVADYNGDDGNVDDENDGQVDAAEYRKDHFGETL